MNVVATTESLTIKQINPDNREKTLTVIRPRSIINVREQRSEEMRGPSKSSMRSDNMPSRKSLKDG